MTKHFMFYNNLIKITLNRVLRTHFPIFDQIRADHQTGSIAAVSTMNANQFICKLQQRILTNFEIKKNATNHYCCYLIDIR